ncbi:MAG: hypothetical protein ABW036_01000 [Flavitalea sp.]
MRSYLSIIAIIVCLSSCKKDKTEAGFMNQYKGDPYMGDVSVTIKAPDGASGGKSGKSSLHFADSTNSILKFVLFGALASDAGAAGDAGFILPGNTSGDNYQFTGSGMQFNISSDGKITGNFLSDKEKTTYTGNITATSFEMLARTELLQENSGGMEAGTVFNFSYNMSRKSTASGNDDEGGSDKKCNRVVWQMRNVYNPGGAMTMISVPVCFD